MQRLSQQSWRSRSPERGRRRQRRRPRQSCFGFFATGQRRFSTSQSQHPLARGRIGRNLRRTFSLRGLLRCRFSLPVFRYTQNTSQYLREGEFACLGTHGAKPPARQRPPPEEGGARECGSGFLQARPIAPTIFSRCRFATRSLSNHARLCFYRARRHSLRTVLRFLRGFSKQ